MSLAGILSSGLGLLGGQGLLSGQGAQSTAQKLKQEFQQLGQDLTAGNLSAAQSDFAALQQNGPQASVTVAASTNTANPITQAFQQLSQDLKAGNLSAAQSDYSTLQQDFQSRATQGPGGHHHHLRDGGSGPSQSNPISTLFSQLGTALQAGNLTAAQTAYSTLQSDFEQFAQSNGFSTGLAAGTGTGLGSSGISINA